MRNHFQLEIVTFLIKSVAIQYNICRVECIFYLLHERIMSNTWQCKELPRVVSAILASNSSRSVSFSSLPVRVVSYFINALPLYEYCPCRIRVPHTLSLTFDVATAILSRGLCTEFSKNKFQSYVNQW